MPDLFAALRTPEKLSDGAFLLPGFAATAAPALLTAVQKIADESRFRHLVTPGGHTMSVAMTNCGQAGWVSDRRGYRYDALDPGTSRPWPPMPKNFLALAADAATAAGFTDFVPDVCLINRYVPGSKLHLHIDRDEHRFVAPIVSVSLGLSATFMWGGLERTDKPTRHLVHHGDVVVFGGPSRRRYHGISLLKAGSHPETGATRLNLTFRKALP